MPKGLFMGTIQQISHILGDDAAYYLEHVSQKLSKDLLHLPGQDFIDRVMASTDRSIPVLRNLQSLFNAGRLGGTGYLSILCADQGIESTAGSAFGNHPMYFDPQNILELALEGGCSAVASSLGLLGAVARRYAHKIPLIVKLNHHEMLSYPRADAQILFADVQQAFNLGAAAVGATIDFGSPASQQQIPKISRAFKYAHDLGLVTVLWCSPRNQAFKKDDVDYNGAADLTGQANYLGASLEADIIQQRYPESNRGLTALHFGEAADSKNNNKIYKDLCTEHPIDLMRYQVLNCYLGRTGLMTSGPVAENADICEITKIAVVNKRAGGMGLTHGLNVLQHKGSEGVKQLHASQDIYLCKEVSIA
jgi:fructose-bisphosphate aldolase, class I